MPKNKSSISTDSLIFKEEENQHQVVVDVAPQEVDSTFNCPKCSSENYIKQGISQSGKQKYLCKDCKRSYILNSTFKHIQKSDDVWTAEDLGLQVKLHLRGNKLSSIPPYSRYSYDK